MRDVNASTRHRRSIRLRDYDYTRNCAYFVTICAHERWPLFGEIVDGEMRLNAWGDIVQAEWAQTAAIRRNVELDVFVVMPNHIHGIIVITGDDGEWNRAQRAAPLHTNDNIVRPQRVAPGVTNDDIVGAQRVAPGIAPQIPAGSLGAIVRGFKAAVTKRIRRLPGAPEQVWQRNYYEHIIRNETSLNQIRQYVVTNPAKWAEDSLFMAHEGRNMPS